MQIILQRCANKFARLHARLIYELKSKTENRFCDLDHKVRSVGGERLRKLTFYISADFR